MPTRRSRPARLARIGLRLAACATAALGVLLGALWLEHRTPLTLPALTGSYAVGRTTYVWTDSRQIDELSPSAEKRTVMVWIWYPSAASAAAPSADYLPPSWRAACARTYGVLMSDFLTRDPAVVRTHSSSDPPIAPDQPSYPVVIVRPGGGALTTDVTSLAEDLASHGYVVVGFDAPYRSGLAVFPGGRVVVRPPAANPEDMPPAAQTRLINRLLPMWSGDAQFVADQLQRLNAAAPPEKFAGRLDMRRLGIFGHSFGGATALQFCHDDPRCRAGIDLDGAPYGSAVRDGVNQPFLFLLSDHGDLAAPENRAVYADLASIGSRSPDGKLLLMIRGANHFSFTDQILVKSRFVIKLLQLFGGGLDPRRGIAITRAYVHTFFDVHLQGAPPGALDQLRREFPEVQPVSKR
ncbi:MAG TPA: hypothetical protein VMI94_21905 [Bryobacteraceae bacterium]|nr:hypothetical protein [Bryobacteraceae bacterium]